MWPGSPALGYLSLVGSLYKPVAWVLRATSYEDFDV
jgi:hypothetical protein